MGGGVWECTFRVLELRGRVWKHTCHGWLDLGVHFSWVGAPLGENNTMHKDPLRGFAGFQHKHTLHVRGCVLVLSYVFPPSLQERLGQDMFLASRLA